MQTRLCIIIPSLGIGGAEKQTVSLINNLNNFEIHVLTLGPHNPLFAEIKTRKIKSCQCLKKKSRFDIFQLLKQANRIIDSINPDVIYCVNLYPIIFTRQYNQKYPNCKIAVSIHSTMFQGSYDQFIFKLIYSKILEKLDRLIFVSEQQRSYWQTYYGLNNVKSMVIHNGIKIERYKEFCLDETKRNTFRQRYGLNEHDFVLCMCTALRPEKNHMLAISAIGSLIEAGIPAKLLIVGDGRMRGKIKSAIEENGLENHVFLVGSKDDVRPYLYLSDLFLLTSHIETFSIAVLEAMAMGLPIIAPNVGGMSEQVHHGQNGFLFEKNNKEQLVSYLTAIFTDGLIDKMGTESSKIIEQYDIKKMTEKYEQLFLELVGR